MARIGLRCGLSLFVDLSMEQVIISNAYQSASSGRLRACLESGHSERQVPGGVHVDPFSKPCFARLGLASGPNKVCDHSFSGITLRCSYTRCRPRMRALSIHSSTATMSSPAEDVAGEVVESPWQCCRAGRSSPSPALSEPTDLRPPVTLGANCVLPPPDEIINNGVHTGHDRLKTRLGLPVCDKDSHGHVENQYEGRCTIGT